MTIKGYSSQGKEERIRPEFATLEPIRKKQHGLSVLAHLFVYSVGTDAVEASSTTSVINATAHAAVKGDVIRFTSGALSGQEVKVYETATNTITLAEDLSAAPAAADTFQILRHKYPTVDSTGALVLTQGPVQFVRDSVDTEALEDTVTPANNRPLPVKLLDTSGNINTVTANQGGTWSVRTQDGTGNALTSSGAGATRALNVTNLDSSGNERGVAPNPWATEGDTVAGAADSGKPVKVGGVYNSALPTYADGNRGDLQLTANGRAMVSAIQEGTWNLTDISGTISLPTGAATSAKQDTGNTSLSNIDGKLPATLGQKAMADSLAVTVASDQSAIPASQSGNWSVRAQDGSGNALTSKTLGSNTGLHVNQLGRTAVDKARNDYSSVSVTTAAYTQLVASLAAECTEIEIFDSSGQTLLLATGAAASEVDQIYIIPGGNGRIPLRIASGTRVSIKAVSATASAGEIDINFYS